MTFALLNGGLFHPFDIFFLGIKKVKVTMIGCPKLDEGDYTEKLTEIISNNDIAGVTIVRMEVALLFPGAMSGFISSKVRASRT